MKKSTKQRADILITESGIAPNVSLAQSYIMAGTIYTNEHIRVEKAGTLYPTYTVFYRKNPPQYVSRGGYKLQTALEHFSIDIGNTICLDIGASTGGFTDCLLQYGASKIYALDVGTNLLHEKLKNDPRVLEKNPLNIRYVTKNDIPDPIDIVVGDISFISLTHIFEPVLPLLAPKAQLCLLLKPQFEAPRASVHNGIVTSTQVQDEAIEKIVHYAAGFPLQYHGSIASKIKGRRGNQEYMVYFSLL